MLCIHQKQMAQHTVPMQPRTKAIPSKVRMDNCITMTAEIPTRLHTNESARSPSRGRFNLS